MNEIHTKYKPPILQLNLPSYNMHKISNTTAPDSKLPTRKFKFVSPNIQQQVPDSKFPALQCSTLPSLHVVMAQVQYYLMLVQYYLIHLFQILLLGVTVGLATSTGLSVSANAAITLGPFLGSASHTRRLSHAASLVQSWEDQERQ